MSVRRTSLAALLCLIALFSLPLAAQENEAPTQVVAVPIPVDNTPEDALGRGNPRDSIIGYLQACSKFDFEQAAEYMDLRNLPAEVAEVGASELARQFNHILSRAVWFDDYSVSNKPGGLKGDGLPDYRDELLVVKTREGEVPVWMQRVPRGDGELIWKISNRSVALIPELYEEFSYPEVVERIRAWFPEDASFLGLEAFKWFIILVGAAISWPVVYMFGRLLTMLFASRANENYHLVRNLFTGPLVAIGILMITGWLLGRLGAGAYAQQIIEAKTLYTAFIVWASWSVINVFRKHKQDKLFADNRPGAAKLLGPLCTFLKLFVVILGLLFWMNNIGINITTVLAGLGVGGLAIALALQKPLEDMMGALTLFSQASIRVGDFCRYGEITGVVEDIGLRTTRLRTLTNTLVSIPNSRIAYVEIENISARTKIRFWPTLRLRYDTTPDQLRAIIDGIRQTLEQHENVYDDPIRVRLTDFADDAILLKLHSFLKTTDFTESLEIAEQLHFRIMDIVHEAGAAFALPGRSVYTEGAAAPA